MYDYGMLMSPNKGETIVSIVYPLVFHLEGGSPGISILPKVQFPAPPKMFAILIINKGETTVSIVTVFIKSCDKYGIGIDMNIHTYIIIIMFMGYKKCS